MPTRREFDDLIFAGYKFDKDKKGMWVAGNKLFFPLSGYLSYTSGVLSDTEYGYLWSSSTKDSSSSWYLSFTDGAAYMYYSGYTTHGFPVRRVQDISYNSTIEEEPLHPSNNIDWEQRRYEIAKDLYCRNNESIEDAISYANEFIKKFK